MSAKKRKPKNDYTEALWAKLYRPMIESQPRGQRMDL